MVTTALTAANAAGHKHWFVPDAFLPSESSNGHISHESICLLNVGEADAEVVITVYFADQDPRVSSPLTVPAQRDLHLRTNEPERLGGLRIPAGVPYAIAVASNVPVFAQYSRLDTTRGAYTLMTVIPAGRD